MEEIGDLAANAKNTTGNQTNENLSVQDDYDRISQPQPITWTKQVDDIAVSNDFAAPNSNEDSAEFDDAQIVAPFELL